MKVSKRIFYLYILFTIKFSCLRTTNQVSCIQKEDNSNSMELQNENIMHLICTRLFPNYQHKLHSESCHYWFENTLQHCSNYLLYFHHRSWLGEQLILLRQYLSPSKMYEMKGLQISLRNNSRMLSERDCHNLIFMLAKDYVEKIPKFLESYQNWVNASIFWIIFSVILLCFFLVQTKFWRNCFGFGRFMKNRLSTSEKYNLTQISLNDEWKRSLNCQIFEAQRLHAGDKSFRILWQNEVNPLTIRFAKKFTAVKSLLMLIKPGSITEFRRNSESSFVEREISYEMMGILLNNHMKFHKSCRLVFDFICDNPGTDDDENDNVSPKIIKYLTSGEIDRRIIDEQNIHQNDQYYIHVDKRNSQIPCTHAVQDFTRTPDDFNLGRLSDESLSSSQSTLPSSERSCSTCTKNSSKKSQGSFQLSKNSQKIKSKYSIKCSEPIKVKRTDF